VTDRDVIFVTCAGVLVAVLVYKLRHLHARWGSPRLWALCAVLFLLVVIMVFSAPVSQNRLNQVTGIPNLAVLLNLCCSSAVAAAYLTLALLWRHRAEPARRSGPGRPSRITVDQVIAAAVEVADTDGMAALSMARVADRIGVAVMSLYTHVASKAELVELMVDAAMRERGLPGPGHPDRPDGWRAQIELYAQQTRAVHRRHPWLREASTVRIPLGPGTMAQQEYLLLALQETGLAPREMFAAASAIATHVDAAAHEEAETAQAEKVTGQSWDAWWAERQLVWEEYFDVTEYPTMSQVWVEGDFEAAGAPDLEDSYDYGLQRLLDGIQARSRQFHREGTATCQPSDSPSRARGPK
jgi:AcrR family transcriptional regulator